MKLTADRPFADPETAARKIVGLTASITPTVPDRIYIELVNYPFILKLGGTGPEFGNRLGARDRAWPA
jgi:hypothetical protein